jgi:hypothetical protein
VTVFGEHGNEIWRCIKGGGFFVQLSDYQLLKKQLDILIVL